jgi:hypothetical protein
VDLERLSSQLASAQPRWRYSDDVDGMGDWLDDVAAEKRSAPIKPETAAGLKSSIRRMQRTYPLMAKFSIDELIQQQERIFAKFREENESTGLSAQSVETYVTRVTSAIRYFLEERDRHRHAAAVRARIAATSPSGDSTGEVSRAIRNKLVHGQTLTADEMDLVRTLGNLTRPRPGRQLIDHKLPLNDGTTVELKLPRNLTHKEGERVARFVIALVMDEGEVSHGR